MPDPASPPQGLPRRRSDGINPGCESRLERIANRLALSWMVAATVWLAVSILLWPWMVVVVATLIPILALAIAAAITTRIAARRSRREIIAADYCLCLECRYPLATLPAEGTCPECGAAYEHEQVRECWKWTLDEGWRR